MILHHCFLSHNWLKFIWRFYYHIMSKYLVHHLLFVIYDWQTLTCFSVIFKLLTVRLFWWSRSHHFDVFLLTSATFCSQNDLSLPEPPLGDKFLINSFSPDLRIPRHDPDFNFLRSFSFLPVDFVSAASKAPSISFFQLSRYPLWLNHGEKSSSVGCIRSVGSLGFLPNRWYAYITLMRGFFQDDLNFSGKVSKWYGVVRRFRGVIWGGA